MTILAHCRSNGAKKGIGGRLWTECQGHIFVALVIMALATTMISGLALSWHMKTRPLS